MAGQDKLEVIKPNGDIAFYDLAVGRGIINIGSDPENDIILDNTGIAPFHAILDYRQKPYQFLLLSDTGEARLRNTPLPSHVSTRLQNWDVIELDGLILVVTEGEGGQSQAVEPASGTMAVQSRPAVYPPPTGSSFAPPTDSPTQPVKPPLPPFPPESIRTPAYQPPAGLPTLPFDEANDNIIVQLSEREWTLNVGQSIFFQVTIGNGGEYVASFDLWVDGVDPNWVTITPPHVQLNEGGQTSVTVGIAPPRDASSRAGVHYLAVVVTSPQYAGRAVRGATLNINPFYEFSITDLSPKEQTISWFKPTGHTVFSITNKGNGETPFRLEGADTEQGCTFEFDLPGESTTLVRQAELSIAPGEMVEVPVQITPVARRLIGMRKHSYAFTITTSLVSGQQTPRSLLGQIRSKPLIGPWLIALFLLLLAALIIIIFRPRIDLFTVQPEMVKAGEPVTLRWNVSAFSQPKIDQNVGVVDGPSGEATAIPEQNTVYRLEAGNWLSRLNPGWFGVADEVRVVVEPIQPEILVFEVDRHEIFVGETVRVSWEVSGADQVVLQTNGSPETLTSEEFTGQRTFQLNETTDFVLIVRNRFGLEASRNQQVLVTVPTPTPTATATPRPAPTSQVFNVQPQEITQGESVTIDWVVMNVSSVRIAPIDGDLPPNGSVSRSLNEPGTIQFILSATNGEQEIQQIREVLVRPAPTGTPVPQKPVIEFFQSTKSEVTLGVDNDIELSWSVTGNVTDVQITGPNFGPVTGLPVFSSLPVTPDETTLYVITAFNGDLSASATVQIKVNPPPTPVPPTPVPTPTPLPPNIVFFKADAASSSEADRVVFVGSNPPTYEVIAGTQINLSWLVQNAIKVTLSVDGTSLGDQPFEGVLPRTVRGNENYLLTATGAQAGGAPTTAQLRITAIQEIPPAPTNLIGEIITNTIRLEWDYNNQDENDIEGFRLYRSDVPPGTNFKRVADEKQLLPGARDWVDTKDLTETCGKAYYIVAVYLDFNGDLQETDASANSWFSVSCP